VQRETIHESGGGGGGRQCKGILNYPKGLFCLLTVITEVQEEGVAALC